MLTRHKVLQKKANPSERNEKRKINSPLQDQRTSTRRGLQHPERQGKMRGLTQN